jgi:hypothetical protein
MLLLVLIACGFATDLLFGLPVLFSSRSWTAWVVGTIALGALYLIGEGGGDWISRDRVDHPLWRRLWHLGLLLGLRSRLVRLRRPSCGWFSDGERVPPA